MLGISSEHKLFNRLPVYQNGLFRFIVSILYTLTASAATAGYIWAFRQDWAVNSSQYVLTWMSFWLYMHIMFLVIDAATAFLPLSAMPFFIITWAVTNVASTIAPFESSAGFYRWGYALPAHETYQIFVQIWSGGCNNQLHRALPILFAWEVLGLTAAVLGMYYRCKTATKLEMDMLHRNTEENAGEENPAATDSSQLTTPADSLSIADQLQYPGPWPSSYSGETEKEPEAL